MVRYCHLPPYCIFCIKSVMGPGRKSWWKAHERMARAQRWRRVVAGERARGWVAAMVGGLVGALYSCRVEVE